jgi:MFS family permease
LGAGIVFGYAALKPVLVKEDVYKYLCTKKELEKGGGTCPSQELRLNLMFTTAAVGTNVAALPIGAILDNFGPRVCGIIGSVLLEVGALLFAFAWQLTFIDAYLLGYLFLALGGPFIFVSSFQLSNAFPKHTGLILALITGAFDTSSALFLIYRKIYEWSHGKFWPKYFFLLYQVVPVYILVAQIFVMPKHSYKTVSYNIA